MLATRVSMKLEGNGEYLYNMRSTIPKSGLGESYIFQPPSPLTESNFE